ncbi:hypothetical protein FACS189468_4680 [Spirochaetia bacterium]|nr:hypothetical protein FACS189468_4680 [Spirochaetia bacterium]
MDDKQFFFERNLLALSKTDPALCSRLSTAETTQGLYKFVESRTGKTVPAWAGSGGAAHPLHSIVDPQKEGARLISTIKDEGFVIFLGLGGGFPIAAALEREDIHQVLAVDYDINGIAELLASRDYIHIFNDPRFRLLVDLSGPALEQYLVNAYRPVLHGSIRVLPLRGRTEYDEEKFGDAGTALKAAIDRVSQDYSVQAYFGTRWFSNIIRNLPQAESPCGPLPPIYRAAVTAAGPSLDLQLPRLARERSSLFLIATDTSLSSLLSSGLEPDAVISIDCQHISYYHFFEGLPEKTLLFLDLASPPLVASRSKNPRFFSGGHPLARYVCRAWRSFPVLDTSGGNVTYAALSLAKRLGAEQIDLYGADFSYPLGRTYARGAYIYPFFENRQTRLSPLENHFSSFLFRSPSLTRLETEAPSLPSSPGKTWYYETRSLAFYREALEKKARSMEGMIHPVPGLGAPIRIEHRIEKPTLGAKTFFNPRPNRTIRLFASGAPRGTARDFLASYRKGIEQLPPLGENLSAFLEQLGEEETALFTTLLPQGAALKRRNPELKNGEVLEEVRAHSLQELARVLEVGE